MEKNSIDLKSFKEEGLKLLQELFSEIDNGYIEFRCIDSKRIKKPKIYLYNSLETINWSKLYEANTKEKYEIYFGIGVRKDKKFGTKDNIKTISAIFADIDNKKFNNKEEALKYLKNQLPELLPSMIIFSGHGYHCYWLLDNPIQFQISEDIAKIEGVVKGLLKYINADTSTFDISRIFRLPRTYNWKNIHNPIMCKIIEFYPKRKYKIQDFEKFYDSKDVKVNAIDEDLYIPTNRLQLTIDDLKKLPELTQEYILKGWKDELKDKYPSRSELDQAVIISMLNKDYSDEEVFSIFANPIWKIGKKYREKGDKYLAYSIKKAKKYLLMSKIFFKREKNNVLECNLDNITYKIHSYTIKEDKMKVSLDVYKDNKFIHRNTPNLSSSKKRKEFINCCKGLDKEMMERHLITIADELEKYEITKRNIKKDEQQTTKISDKLLNKKITLEDIHKKLNIFTSSNYSHDAIEIALAVVCSEPISREKGYPVWLLEVGPPSSDKTATVTSLKFMPNVYFLDVLTENAFISGYMDHKKSYQKDLLSDLDKKCFIVKDLTSLFSKNEELVKTILGDLQSIYDGNFTKYMGTRGRVSYNSTFSFIGCITPLVLSQHHRYMSMIGGRFLFYRIWDLNENEIDKGFEISWKSLKKDVREYFQRMVSTYGYQILQKPIKEIKITDKQKQQMNALAELLANGRAIIKGFMKEREDKKGKTTKYYEIDKVQKEQPWRGLHQLQNLAFALARIHNRDFLTKHDLELLRRIVISSMPVDRSEVLFLYQKNDYLEENGGLSRLQCALGLAKSYNRAEQLLQELVRIGILKEEKKYDYIINYFYYPIEEFKKIITKPILPLDHIKDLKKNTIV